MDKCDWDIATGSVIGKDTAFDKLQECKGTISREKAKEFASQCLLDEEGGAALYAEDYNNWGCCLAWDGDLRGAAAKFAAGLKARHRATDGTQKAKTVSALGMNLVRCRPDLSKVMKLCRDLDESGATDIAEVLRKALDAERGLVR